MTMTSIYISFWGSLAFVCFLFTNPLFYKKKGLFFSVNVNPEFGSSALAHEIFISFRRKIWIVFVIACSPLLGAFFLHSTSITVLACYFLSFTLLIAGFLFGVHQARQQTLPHRVPLTSKRRASLLPLPQDGKFRNILMLQPYLTILGFAIILLLNWDAIPQRFVVHWGISGQPNGWITKTLFNVLRPGLIGVWTLLFLHLALSPLYRGKGGLKRIPLGFALIFMYTIALLSGCMLILPFFSGELQGLLQNAFGSYAVVGTAVLLLVVFATTILIWAQQEKNLEEEPDSTPSDDQFWKGDFYNNPNDPVLFVEKKIGLGYTLNIANPSAKLAIIGFVGWIVVLFFIVLI